MTGLSVDAMEPLTVENFGVAGPVRKESVQQHEKGNKMAMILFYVRIHAYSKLFIVLLLAFAFSF